MYQFCFIFNSLTSFVKEKNVRIYEYIESHPGKTSSEIIKELAISSSTARFHMNKLVEHKMVKLQKIDKIRYFTNDQNYEKQIRISLENNIHLKTIIDVLDKPKTLDEIFEKTKVSKSLLSKRLKVLRELGVVEKITREQKIVFALVNN